MITAVTGASGHVGINLVRALTAHGRDVRIIAHNSTLGLEDLKVERRSGDVNDPDSLARACAPIVTAVSRWTGARPIFTSVSLKALASNRNISHARATRELGYEPRLIRETLADTIRWFMDNGFIKGKGRQ